MFGLNFISFFSFLLNVYFVFFIFFRKDIGLDKNNLFLILLIYSYFSIATFILNFTFLNEGYKVSYFILFLIYIFLNFFLFFYYFENYFKKGIIKVLYPVIIFLFTTIVYIFLPVFIQVGSPMKISFVEKFFYDLKNFCIYFSILWSILLLFSFFQKRLFFLFLSLVNFLFFIFIFFDISHKFIILNFSLLFVLSPIFLILDFFKIKNRKLFLDYNPQDVLNTFNFGIVVVKPDGRVHTNRYLSEIFEFESTTPEKWFYDNKDILLKLEDNNFFIKEFIVGKNTYNFIIEKIKKTDLLNRFELYVIFNYNNVKILEKLSKEYTNFVFNTLTDRIYHYNIQNQYKRMYDFLKGFAHNSFSMISVIKAGFDYILDNIDDFEKFVHTSKKNVSLKDYFIDKINLMQKTLNLTIVGLQKLMESFKILNNKIKYEYDAGKSNFSINDFVDQEIFFYITNTEYKYTINIEKKLEESLRDVVFEYRVLSTIFHNILKFVINEMATVHIKRIIVQTYEKDGKIIIRVESSAKDFQKDKIDEILNRSSYIADDRYVSLINAYLLIKSSGSNLRMVDSDFLIFEIELNE